ncbi:hypothetical protein [Streptomyces angustmyceticus]|uniref:hypothetical protein n=1 Tax=Streptomyces angustmyceticus TaxID=285578 RepID=UPI003D8EE523
MAVSHVFIISACRTPAVTSVRGERPHRLRPVKPALRRHRGLGRCSVGFALGGAEGGQRGGDDLPQFVLEGGKLPLPALVDREHPLQHARDGQQPIRQDGAGRAVARPGGHAREQGLQTVGLLGGGRSVRVHSDQVLQQMPVPLMGLIPALAVLQDLPRPAWVLPAGQGPSLGDLGADLLPGHQVEQLLGQEHRPGQGPAHGYRQPWRCLVQAVANAPQHRGWAGAGRELQHAALVEPPRLVGVDLVDDHIRRQAQKELPHADAVADLSVDLHRNLDHPGLEAGVGGHDDPGRRRGLDVGELPAGRHIRAQRPLRLAESIRRRDRARLPAGLEGVASLELRLRGAPVGGVVDEEGDAHRGLRQRHAGALQLRGGAHREVMPAVGGDERRGRLLDARRP